MSSLKKQSRAALADTYGRVARKFNVLKAQREELREELLRRRVRTFVGDRFVITVNEAPMSILDQTRFCKERPKLYAEYMREVEIRRVEVIDRREG